MSHLEIVEKDGEFDIVRINADKSRTLMDSTYCMAAAVTLAATIWANALQHLLYAGYEVTGPENSYGALGWARYVDGEQMPATVECGRIGWLAAASAEMDVTQRRQEYEMALAVGRQYEATGNVGVFFHASYR